MSLTRRELMKYGLSASGVLLLPLQFPKKALADTTSPPPPTDPWATFTTELAIPPVLLPYDSQEAQGDPNDPDYRPATDYYEIVLSKQNQRFLSTDQRDYEFWGYNSMFPGPTIKQSQNRQANVTFVNLLDQTTIGSNGCPQSSSEPIRAVIHLHGMASLPEYDGYAEDYIKPNQYKTYLYPNDRPATFWYHDHQLGRTMRNVGMGLVGMWIVQDETECKLNLPQGQYDVPLIFQNPPFTWQAGEPTKSEPDRTYINCDDSDKGLFSKDLPPTLINGVYQPLMKVDTHKYRFRLLNATANEVYNLVLVSYDPDKQQCVDQSITIVGTDSGLRDCPVPTPDLQFVMADRYEIIIDFNNRQIGSKMALVDRAGGVDTPLICFEVVNAVTDQSNLPYQLRPYRSVNPETASLNHGADEEFIFDFKGISSCAPDSDAASINGQVWDSNLVQAYPLINTWQKWRLINNSNAIHPVHIHLLDFQLLRRLDKDGKEVCLRPYEQNSWKDVFNLGPYETLEIIGRFGPHVGKYMMHCHNLGHEDCDMMTQFQVIDPTSQQQANDPITGAPAVNLSPEYQPHIPAYNNTNLCPVSIPLSSH